jgi:hypothetical protein
VKISPDVPQHGGFERNSSWMQQKICRIGDPGPILRRSRDPLRAAPAENRTILNMSQIIPLISSGTAGPLGVLHLPRLWLKASLGAAGKLHSDYPAIGQGYDQMVLDALSIDKAAFEKFIADSKPTYPQLEAWILDQSGGSLDAAAVEKLNAAITGYIHSDDTRAAILGADSIKDDGKVRDAVNLNNIDDWHCFHQQTLA